MTAHLSSAAPQLSTRPRVVLIHGTATTAAIWGKLSESLADFAEVITPQRASSGVWDAELDDLAELCAGSFVVGVSGGATLGLGLLQRGVPVRGAVLHEPAAGRLAPRLLDAAVAAMATGGPHAFGSALYGRGWTSSMLPADPDAVARDLAMFRRFEPAPTPEPMARVLLTVGEDSPPIRHDAVAAVAHLIGARMAVIPGGLHAVHVDSVPAFAAVIIAELGTPSATPRTVDAARAHLSTKGT
jgi:pimeloyl-ACP methyl ester carboxylesterase